MTGGHGVTRTRISLKSDRMSIAAFSGADEEGIRVVHRRHEGGARDA